MCGIFTMFNPEGFDEIDKQVFWHGMFLNQLRGTHSTGAFGVSLDKDKGVDLVKVTGGWNSFITQEHAKEYMERISKRYCVAVGHGRYANVGAITPENAHPFNESHIHLVHNGKIDNFHDLRNHFGWQSCTSDSKLVTWMLSQFGIKSTIEAINGAYVFVWYDDLLRTFNIIKNKERPFSLFYAPPTKGANKYEYMLGASEDETLLYLSSRYNIPGSLFSLSENVHYAWHVESGELQMINLGKAAKKLKMPSVTVKHPSASTPVVVGDPPAARSSIVPFAQQNHPKQSLLKVAQTVYKKGELVEFYADTFKPIGSVSGNKYMVKGTLIEDSTVHIMSFVTLENEEDVKQYTSYGMFEGVVDSITTGTVEGRESIVLLLQNHPKPIETSKQTPSKDVDFIFWTQDVIPMKRAINILAMGCTKCKKKLPSATMTALKGNEPYCITCFNDKDVVGYVN